MADEAKTEEPAVLRTGFCRLCRMDVDVIEGKKGPVCARCGIPRVD